MFFPANLLVDTEEAKTNTTKANIRPEHKISTKNYKPGLVASYDLQPGNGAEPILQLPPTATIKVSHTNQQTQQTS